MSFVIMQHLTCFSSAWTIFSILFVQVTDLQCLITLQAAAVASDLLYVAHAFTCHVKKKSHNLYCCFFIFTRLSGELNFL